MKQNMNNIKLSNLRWLGLSVLVVAIDQLTKWLIVKKLILYTQIPLLSWFNIVHVRNYGAAFSFLNSVGGAQRWLFSALSLIVSIILVVWLLRVSKAHKWLSASISLIIGGALGNLWGRLFNGYVIDFLDFHLGSYHWPAFNVADSAVCLGAIIMMWLFVTERAV